MTEKCKTSLLSFAVAAVFLTTYAAALGQGLKYHLGRSATADEIRPLDIAIGPSGKELPPGSGTVKEGAKIYAEKCAVCHGATGTEGPPPRTAGKPPRLVGKDALAAWSYATSIWDFINRAMPGGEQSLRPNEVYAVTALLLYRNGIIQETDVMDAKTLPKVRMPNH